MGGRRRREGAARRGAGGGRNAPSITFVTCVCAGRPWLVMKSEPTFIPDFFSSAFAPLPIHTKIELPASRIIT